MGVRDYRGGWTYTPVKYESRAERAIRIGQWIATALVIVTVAAGILAGLWGLSIPDPSMVRP